MTFAGSPSCRRSIAVGLVLGVCLLVAPRTEAAEKYGNSLDLVPADVSFYSGSLRLKEQAEILLQSKAWARLLEMPAVKMALGMAKAEFEKPGGPKEQLERSLENPDNQRLLELLKDMASQEVFIYGDKQFADSLALLLDAINAAQYAPLFNKLAGGDGSDEQARIMALLETLNDNLDRLAVPDLVIGFKISDPARADLQIRRLETLVNVVVQLLTINEFKDRFGRVSVGGHDFIELRLDGRLVPWEELPFNEYAENPGDYEKLKQHLRSLKLTIDLGVRDGYVLFSIGDSNQHLANLGKGELLVNRPEMKALRAQLSKPLVSVGYTSKALNALVTGTKEDVEELLDMARQFVPHTDLDEDVQKRILEDAEAFAKDIEGIIPEPGASASFSFLTPRGYESYSYNWTQNKTIDDSKRLALLDHVGGNPVLAAVGRSKYSPQQYDMLVKWLVKGYGYFEQFGLAHMPAEEREKFEQVAKIAIPLLQRVNAATRDDLIPGLADGQAGIVIDADITSMRWHSGMPSLGQPLPMAEIALVFGVSDAERVKKAFREYKAVAQSVLETVRELNPEARIPEGFTIPAPQARDAGDGQVYWYPIPKSSDFHVDPQLQPAVGLSKNVAVASTSIKQVERMLTATPLATKSNVIAERKSAGSAIHFDFPGLVDAVRPWIELAVAQHSSENEDEGKPDAKFIIEQIRAGAEILKCYRGTTSVTYLEDGATVTHRESVFEDLK
jgi:hypothetical protein